MADSSVSVTKRPLSQHLKRWSVPAIILLMAAGIVFLITGNWNTWASEEGAQKTRRRLRTG